MPRITPWTLAVCLLGCSLFAAPLCAQDSGTVAPGDPTKSSQVKDALGLVLAARPFPVSESPESLTKWAVAARLEVLSAIRASQDRGDQRTGALLGLRLQALRRYVWTEVGRLRGDR